MSTDSISVLSISKPWLEKVIDKEIVSYSVRGGSNPGDNFTSVLYGVKVIIREDESPLHLLIKVYPTLPVRQKFLQDTNLFLTELLAYRVLFPAYVEMQVEMGISRKNMLYPAIPPFINGQAVNYDDFAKDSPTAMNEVEQESNSEGVQNYILMLDVRRALGFKMADKREGLDYNHCKLVITELAKIHSLSLAYKNQIGVGKLVDKFPFLEESVFSTKCSMMEPLINGNFQLVLNILENALGGSYEGLDSLKKMQSRGLKLIDIFLSSDGVNESKAREMLRVDAVVDRPEVQWIVGGHGDCWINNFLFRYNSDHHPVEVILVDLQMIRESCITVDLAYFIYNSTDSLLRKEWIDQLLADYYEAFIKSCSVLKTQPFEGFTLENLKGRFHRSKILGLLFSILVLPIILQKPENAVDLDKMEHPPNGSSESKKVEDFLASMVPSKGSDDAILCDRFVGMIQELVAEGVI